jgi:hypothetical protein
MARTLQERLDGIRTAFEEKVDADTLAIVHGATAQLVESGAADRALGVGDSMPSFALPDADGATVRSEELLRHGPLVLTFFRGHW